jgi:hypothetical protein
MDVEDEEVELRMTKVGVIPCDQRQREQVPIKPTKVDDAFMEIVPMEGNEEKSGGTCGHDSHVLPGAPRASFASIHQDFLLLVRQVGEIHVQGEEHILEMRATLATAFAETLQDQGDLEGMLDRLYELGEEMDEHIAHYEDFMSHESQEEL